ncbi:hypothetical protein BsWGS_00967 [Bradybaena similaris]
MASGLRLLVEASLKQRILAVCGAPLVHSVRFRKPRWVPIAKSKEFYVRKPTPVIPEERDELKVRYRLYRAEVDSLRQFLQQELSATQEIQKKQISKADEADVSLMKEHLDEWNQHVATARKERQLQEELEHEQMVRELLAKEEKERMLAAEKALAELKQKEAAAANIIEPDRLDEAIEKLIDSRSDYNFAITKAGEKLIGEYPEKKKLQTYQQS